MHVGLYEAWQQIAAAGVDHFLVAPFRYRADCGNDAVADENASFDDRQTIVHRQDGCVADVSRRH
jgi:hypothetical protein